MNHQHLRPSQIHKVTLNYARHQRDAVSSIEQVSGKESSDMLMAIHPVANLTSLAALASPLWQSAPQHEETQAHNQASPCIFIIDDSPTICIIVETVLQSAGYKVCSFQNGIDALQWLEQPGAQAPDLLLVDIHLPKIDGFEVIRRFKAQPSCANSISIILSRYDSLVNQIKGNLVGVQGYITKPFTTQTLLKTIHTYLPNDQIKPD